MQGAAVQTLNAFDAPRLRGAHDLPQQAIGSRGVVQFSVGSYAQPLRRELIAEGDLAGRAVQNAERDRDGAKQGEIECIHFLLALGCGLRRIGDMQPIPSPKPQSACQNQQQSGQGAHRQPSMVLDEAAVAEQVDRSPVAIFVGKPKNQAFGRSLEADIVGSRKPSLAYQHAAVAPHQPEIIVGRLEGGALRCTDSVSREQRRRIDIA